MLSNVKIMFKIWDVGSVTCPKKFEGRIPILFHRDDGDDDFVRRNVQRFIPRVFDIHTHLEGMPRAAPHLH